MSRYQADYDYIVVLDCGGTFGFFDHRANDGESLAWQVDHYTSCDDHSPIYGYDPDKGWPLHERDRKVVAVLPAEDEIGRAHV